MIYVQCNVSGLEVFYQVAGQILLLIYAKTKTRTTGGLETVFDQDSFMGLQMNPVITCRFCQVSSFFFVASFPH